MYQHVGWMLTIDHVFEVRDRGWQDWRVRALLRLNFPFSALGHTSNILPIPIFSKIKGKGDRWALQLYYFSEKNVRIIATIM